MSPDDNCKISVWVGTHVVKISSKYLLELVNFAFWQLALWFIFVQIGTRDALQMSGVL